ncbi:MAG: hypothetical protein L0H83_01810 [Salinisphaera sp.]|nr:hypothetical protein [Salinisphaera sp.]
MISTLPPLVLLLATAIAVGAQAATAPPTPADPAGQLRIAHLRYLLATRDALTALSWYHSLPAHALAGRDRLDLRLEVAKLLLNFGLLDAASALYRDSLHRSADARRNRGWFRLTQAWLARGAPDRALDAVERIYGLYPPALEGRVAPLAARVLLANEQPRRAVKRLRRWQHEEQENPFGRYNLGVALVRAGKNLQGVGEINTVARMDAQDRTSQALRDQANLVLAYGFLDIAQGATARALFERVRLHGPASAKALLGLGWAELAPDGQVQPYVLMQPIHCVEDMARLLPENLPILRRPAREACGPPQLFRNQEDFEQDAGADSQDARYRRALVPWLTLARREPALTPVQEALVAIPRAYAELGALDRAKHWYTRAITVLQTQRDAATRLVHRLTKIGARPPSPPPAVTPDLAWFARHWRIPGANANPYLTKLASRDPFRCAAQALQELGFMGDRIELRHQALRSWDAPLQHQVSALTLKKRPIPDNLASLQQRARRLATTSKRLLGRVEKTRAGVAGLLQTWLLTAARAYSKRVDAYLVQARTGQARIYQPTSAEQPAGGMQ